MIDPATKSKDGGTEMVIFQDTVYEIRRAYPPPLKVRIAITKNTHKHMVAIFVTTGHFLESKHMSHSSLKSDCVHILMYISLNIAHYNNSYHHSHEQQI